MACPEGLKSRKGIRDNRQKEGDILEKLYLLKAISYVLFT